MYYFIVNKTGGKGRALRAWMYMVGLLKQGDIEYSAYLTAKKGDARRYARRISEINDPDKRIVVVGGDGTINEVVNGITDFDRVSLGIIPSGSGNDFARGLGIPTDPAGAWERIAGSDGSRQVDLGRISFPGERPPHLFAISAGIGLDAIVCKKVDSSRMKSVLNKIGLGSLTYIIITVITLFTMRTTRAKVRYSSSVDIRCGKDIENNELSLDKMIFLAGMNVSAEGGGVRMAPEARVDDGLLSACMAAGIPKWKAFILLPFLSAGKHSGKKGFYLFDGAVVDISLDEPTTVHADGEYMGEHAHIVMESIPGIRMLI